VVTPNISLLHVLTPPVNHTQDSKPHSQRLVFQPQLQLPFHHRTTIQATKHRSSFQIPSLRCSKPQIALTGTLVCSLESQLMLPLVPNIHSQLQLTSVSLVDTQQHSQLIALTSKLMLMSSRLLPLSSRPVSQHQLLQLLPFHRRLTMNIIQLQLSFRIHLPVSSKPHNASPAANGTLAPS